MRLKSRGPLGPINREFKLRRLAGEALPRYADFVAQHMAEMGPS